MVVGDVVMRGNCFAMCPETACGVFTGLMLQGLWSCQAGVYNLSRAVPSAVIWLAKVVTLNDGSNV